MAAVLHRVFLTGHRVLVEFWASQVVQEQRIQLPMLEMQEIQILGLKRSPGEEMASHSSILAWKIPWREEPGGLELMGSQSQTWLSTSRVPANY